MRTALLLFFFASALSAQEPFVCGTTPANMQAVESRARWIETRDALRSAKGKVAPDIFAKNNVIVIPADDTNAPFRQPFDLTGKSLTFTRTGESFTESTGPLTYDDSVGVVLQPSVATRSATYTLANFDFPFLGGRTTRKLYISQLHAIYFDTPPPVPVASFTQYNEVEALSAGQPVIAPLLTTSGGLNGRYPDIFIKDGSDRVTISWIVGVEAIQAVLFSNGNIRFSYRNIGLTRHGALVITAGDESWRAPAEIVSATDSANDVSSSFSPGLQPMLDITNVSLRRLGTTNFLQMVIKLRGPFDRSQIGTGNYAVYEVRIGDPGFDAQYIDAYFSGSGSGSDALINPMWDSQPTSAMRADGDTITITTAQEQWLPSPSTTNRPLVVNTYWKNRADTVSLNVSIGAPQQFARTSFLNSSGPLNGPIVETFTLPILNPDGVWSEISSAYQIDPTQVDGVAIYQNFFTDLILYAGAYSTGGNPGVDGIKRGTISMRSTPRSPALMHMNAIRYRSNLVENEAAFLLMHEFGHRWLQSINIIENGGLPTGVLNPLTAHPAQYVDTRAAFNVYTQRDASVMGGASFVETTAGVFATPPETFAWSYSWLDLYLMGLAAPEEVQPFFYLANSTPALGLEYNPPTASTYTATRHDLTLKNVTDAMGSRRPSYPDTQRVMRLVFVLISDPTKSVTDDDIGEVTKAAHAFGVAFASATGNRASIVSTFTPPPPPRRRAAGR